MAWISLAQNENEARAPSFSLFSSNGVRISLDQYRGRSNIVLFFAHSFDCKPCSRIMRYFSAKQSEYRQRNTGILCIMMHSDVLLPSTWRSDFPILYDPDHSVRRSYCNLIAANNYNCSLLFILDRFGAPFAAAIVEDFDPMIHNEVLEWLDFIKLQCPE